MRTDFPTLLHEHKITPDLCDGLLSRITDVMKKTHEKLDDLKEIYRELEKAA